MFNVAEIESTITTLRAQAKALNQAADGLEATIAPWKALAEQSAQMQKAMESWFEMFKPKT